MSFFKRRVDTVDQVMAALQVDAPVSEVEAKRNAFNEAAAHIRVHSDTEEPFSFTFMGLTVFIYRGSNRALMIRIQAPDGDRSKLIWLNELEVALCRDPEIREKSPVISSHMREDIEVESKETWGTNFFGRIPIVVDSWGSLAVELRVPLHRW